MLAAGGGVGGVGGGVWGERGCPRTPSGAVGLVASPAADATRSTDTSIAWRNGIRPHTAIRVAHEQRPARNTAAAQRTLTSLDERGR